MQSGSRWHDQRAAAEIDRINRVLACGNEALVITCQGCGAQHERGQGCGASRFCLTCRGVSAAELRGKFLAAREDVVAEATDARLLDPRRRGGPYGDKFLTLTVPHVGTDTIARRIERVLAAWTVFLRLLNDYFKSRVIRRVEWLRVLEWTPGNTDQLGHPHLHLWFFAPYLDHEMLREYWRRALLAGGCPPEHCASPVLDIRAMKDPRSGALELIKYLTKDISANGERLDAELYAQVINALDSHRQTQCSRGFMSRAKKAPRLCEEVPFTLAKARPAQDRKPTE